jgi:magnesium chelatase accessory protein
MNAAAELDLDWERDGPRWPLHEASRFVEAGGLRWHVQLLGHGPVALLVHGTGASTHSWRTLAPLLAARCTVLACDLPGHGFTRGVPAGGMSLTGMSGALASLLRVLAIRPALAVGHSAGVAIAARMVLDRQIEPRGLISLNGALLPFDGLQGMMFSPLAKVLAILPFAPQVFSWGARDRSAVERLIASTGSRLDEAGIDLYWQLVRSPAHIAGVLRMMAQWNLEALARDLPQLTVPLALFVGSRDQTVPPSMAARVQALLPGAMLVPLPGLGHLAHEERAGQVAQAILEVAEQWHVIAAVA